MLLTDWQLGTFLQGGRIFCGLTVLKLLLICAESNEAIHFNGLTKLVGNRWVGDKWVN